MIRLLAILLICFFTPAYTLAWETKMPTEGTRLSWQSIYASLSVKKDSDRAWDNNEHARLSHLALKELGVAHHYSIHGPRLSVIDLNTSVLRESLREYGSYIKERPLSPLEERLLPPPVHYAGIPDFSYTMYDWINKNAYCPPGLPSGPGSMYEKCHEFVGWMGALNSSHFGTQAALWYLHLHDIALKLAERAKDMREKLGKKGKVTLDDYTDYIKEAEHEALAFEGYAQHFLQDRWSIGHMWERWNAADYNQLVFKGYYDNLETSGAAGLLHGSQSVTTLPDPLSSPYLNIAKSWSLIRRLFGESKYIIPTWDRFTDPTTKEIFLKEAEDALPYRAPPIDTANLSKTNREILQQGGGVSMEKPPYNGVGDNRVEDMLDGLYGKAFGLPDRSLYADTQKEAMLGCMTAGWADVIKAFGRSEASGGYGVSGVLLSDSVVGLTKDPDLLLNCFNPWATNSAIALGWSDIITSFATAVSSTIAFLNNSTIAGKVVGEYLPLKNDRIAWGRVTYRIWRYSLTDPDETTLARGAIGDFGKVKHGGNYKSLPGYIEPEDLDELPDELDKNGRDKLAIYGFFNRAHADWWCEDGPHYLEGWRGSGDKSEQAACNLIADRFYAGTDRAYNGVRREDRKVKGASRGREVFPICSIYGRDIPEFGYNDRVPVTIAPGYVAEPYKRGAYDFSTDAISNWCKKVPVLELLNKPGERDEDVVAIVRDLKHNALLNGHNLGKSPGSIILDSGIVVKGQDILEWGNNSILFKVNEEWFKAKEDWEVTDGDYLLTIKRSDGVRSVGRFVLRVKLEPSGPEEPVTDLTGCWKDPFLPQDAVISITQSGKHVVATVPVLDRPHQENRVDLVHEGTFTPPKLVLTHQVKDLKSVEPLLYRLRPLNKDLESYQGSSQLAGRLSSRFEMHVVEGPNDYFPLTGSDREGNFHLEGTHFPIISNLQSFFPVVQKGTYLSIDTDLPVPMSMKDFRKELEKNCSPPDLLLYREISREIFEVMCWGLPGEEESNYPDQVWEKVSTVKLDSFTITDASYSSPLKEVKEGDRIWVKGTASSGCHSVRDHYRVTVRPIKDRDLEITVMLKETGPETLEFRSDPEGILIGEAKEEARPEKKPEKRVPENKPVKDNWSGSQEQKDMLKGEEQEKRRQLLEAMRERTNRLERNPRADTSEYDKRIEELKQDIKFLEDSQNKLDKKRVKEPNNVADGKESLLKEKAGAGSQKADKAQLAVERKSLEEELKSRKETLKNLANAKALYIRHYQDSEGKILKRVETTKAPELSKEKYKVVKTDNLLYMRKAQEHLKKEIGMLEAELNRLIPNTHPTAITDTN